MQNNYKASWVVPASDHPRMVPDMGKAIEDIDKHRAEGKAVVWGNGTETQAALMSFRIREVVDWALGAEAGISDSGGKLSLQLATMHYDFTRTALGEEGVESAEVDFEIAEVSLDEGQIPAELRLTINSNIHRVMASGEKKLHMSASETLAIPLTVLDSPES